MDRLLKLGGVSKPKSKIDGQDSLHDWNHRAHAHTSEDNGPLSSASLGRLGSGGTAQLGSSSGDQSSGHFNRVSSGSGHHNHHNHQHHQHHYDPHHPSQHKVHDGQDHEHDRHHPHGHSDSKDDMEEGSESPLGRQLREVREHVAYDHGQEEEKRNSQKPQFKHNTVEELLLDEDEDDDKVIVHTRGRHHSIVADLLQPNYAPEDRARTGRGVTASEASVTTAGMTKLRYEASHHGEVFGRETAEDDADQLNIRLDISSKSPLNSAAADRERLKQKRQEAKKVVAQAYKAVLGRAVDASGLKHYTTCMVEEGVDRDELIVMLCNSDEFRQTMLARHEQLLERTREEWENLIYPWIANEDSTDFEPGTVSWQRNDEKKKERTWMTGNIKGNSRGMEVFEGRLVYSIMDNWKTVCTESGFANGVHWWSVTKMLRSHAGEKGRLGVVVMDTELDTDLKKEGAFKGRAFFIAEDGNLWDGDCFVSKGVDFGTAGYVVTMRLDCYTGELTFWVASKAPEGHSADPYVLQGEEMGTFCGTIKIPQKAIKAGLYPFVQDMYGGSCWSFSQFETEGPGDLADKEKWVKEQALAIQKAMGVGENHGLLAEKHEGDDEGLLDEIHRTRKRSSLPGTDMMKATFNTSIRVKAMPNFSKSKKNFSMTKAFPSPVEQLLGSNSDSFKSFKFSPSQSKLMTSKADSNDKGVAGGGLDSGSGSFHRTIVDPVLSAKKARASMIGSTMMSFRASTGSFKGSTSPADFAGSFRKSPSKVPTAAEFLQSFKKR